MSHAYSGHARVAKTIGRAESKSANFTFGEMEENDEEEEEEERAERVEVKRRRRCFSAACA